MGSLCCSFFETPIESADVDAVCACEARSQARAKEGVPSDAQHQLKKADQSHLLLNQLTILPNSKSIGTEVALGKTTVASVGSERKLPSTSTNIKNIPTNTKYTFNSHLPNGLDQAKESKEVMKKVGHRLAHDQKLQKTSVHGFEVNRNVTQVGQILVCSFLSAKWLIFLSFSFSQHARV